MRLKNIVIFLIAFLLNGFIFISAHCQSFYEQGTYANLPGVKLWYLDSGGNGTPIILLHANTGNSSIWQKQWESFVNQGYRVIAFDRRNWGKSYSDPSTGPQPGSIAGDLEALRKYLKIQKFHLLGVAGGGFAALDYAPSHQASLKSLMIGGSTGQISEPEIQNFIKLIEIPGIRKISGIYREISPSYRGENPQGVKEWMEIEEHSQQVGTPNQPLSSKNTFEKISTLNIPVLIITSDADLLAPPGLMKIWAKYVKNHTWKVLQDAGHAMNWERPDEFNSFVLEFLKNNP